MKWSIIKAPRRVDSLNFSQFTEMLVTHVDAGYSHIALDLKRTEFLSLPALKFLMDTAELLRSRDGDLALIKPCERVQMHLEVFTKSKLFLISQQMPESPEHDASAYF